MRLTYIKKPPILPIRFPLILPENKGNAAKERHFGVESEPSTEGGSEPEIGLGLQVRSRRIPRSILMLSANLSILPMFFLAIAIPTQELNRY
jgi:hypothetical protein